MPLRESGRPGAPPCGHHPPEPKRVETTKPPSMSDGYVSRVSGPRTEVVTRGPPGEPPGCPPPGAPRGPQPPHLTYPSHSSQHWTYPSNLATRPTPPSQHLTYPSNSYPSDTYPSNHATTCLPVNLLPTTHLPVKRYPASLPTRLPGKPCNNATTYPSHARQPAKTHPDLGLPGKTPPSGNLGRSRPPTRQCSSSLSPP